MPSSLVPLKSKIPMLGYGTYLVDADSIEECLTTAIESGYRLIDCAAVYGNEKEVGVVLEKLMRDGKVKREELYVVSKLWNTCHHPDDVRPALERSLADLRLTYVDLYLIHWPYSFKRGSETFPRDSQGRVLYEDFDYLDTWKIMEVAHDDKLTRAIGVSNFNSRQIRRLLNDCRIAPAVNQIEVHAYFSQKKIVEFCTSVGIEVMAYSPLSHFAPASDQNTSGNSSNMLKDETLVKIGKMKGKSAAQVALRWLIERNIITIPKSKTISRIKENIQIFDFELSPEEIKNIENLNKDIRIVVPLTTNDKGEKQPRDEAAPHYPFKVNDSSFF